MATGNEKVSHHHNFSGNNNDETAAASVAAHVSAQPTEEDAESKEAISNNDNTTRTPAASCTPRNNSKKRKLQQMSRLSETEQPQGWRVKVYRLNTLDGSWDDYGTGRILCQYKHEGDPSSPPSLDNHAPAQSDEDFLFQQTGQATLQVWSERTQSQQHTQILLQSRILLRDAYQKQGDNIITWCEPSIRLSSLNELPVDETNEDFSPTLKTSLITTLLQPPDKNPEETGDSSTGPGGVLNNIELALSFQDNQGCMDIWKQITQVQTHAADILRINEDHHDSTFDHLTVVDGNRSANSNNTTPNSNNVSTLKLPNPPTLANLEEVADTIATMQHVQQRNSLAYSIAEHECRYLKELLALFPQAERNGDYGKLATLAACVKTILLINDPTILELIISVSRIFEEVCTTLEYDPDLREKANHRWFLRERARFRTVVPMEDPDLVEAIHRSFRINYIRDTLLRPAMDEPALSTLSSIQTMCNVDVIKGVTFSNDRKQAFSLQDSYLSKVIKMLGVELQMISSMEWSDCIEREGHNRGKERRERRGVAEDEDDGNSLHHTASASVDDNSSTRSIGGAGESDVPSAPRPTASARRAASVHQHVPDPSIVVGKHSLDTTTWRQYLEPQDGSLSNRKRRRRGCLLFLRELFNMVRYSLQPAEKESFFTKVCSLKIELTQEEAEIADNVSQTSQMCEVGSVTSTSVASTIRSERLDDKTELPPHILQVSNDPVNFLSLLATTLADPNIDTSETGAALEILLIIALHDASLIRFHCIEIKGKKKESQTRTGMDQKLLRGRPDPNGKKQVLFVCPPNDLLAALLFQLDTSSDAGILLQVNEILRIILDTDTLNDHGPFAEFTDETEIPTGQHSSFAHHDQPKAYTDKQDNGASNTEQKQFLALFYEYYIEWLVSPFQHKLFYVSPRIPDAAFTNPESYPSLEKLIAQYRQGVSPTDPSITRVHFSSMRSSFAVELLAFCVRVHIYRMKFFLLRSPVLGSVLNLLRPDNDQLACCGGDRCLKLAALRFLRVILSVNDDAYHRHIIENDLFAPVFETLRSNPVGDNLVSSSIVEMCDYIHAENIVPLIEYIVTKHIRVDDPSENEIPTLEDVSSPYVTTLTVLRKAYESNLNGKKRKASFDMSTATGPSDFSCPTTGTAPPTLGGAHFFAKSPPTQDSPRVLAGRAMEGPRNFQEQDITEESYFEEKYDLSSSSGGSSMVSSNSSVPTGAVDEVGGEKLHRTPRMFSLSQAPLFNHIMEESSSLPSSSMENNGLSNNDLESPALDIEDSPPASMGPESNSNEMG